MKILVHVFKTVNKKAQVKWRNEVEKTKNKNENKFHRGWVYTKKEPFVNYWVRLL